ncbi:MAG: T9SS type A sorting domain-containing protein [Bacteroidales bacterium]|nr:T9SS type A sorting domain-containing protein [Bacteroidales bacterium]
MVKRIFFVLLVVFLAQPNSKLLSQQIYEIQPGVTYLTSGSFSSVPGPGDIIKIIAPRSEKLKIVGLSGDSSDPILIINSGGQVNINTSSWGALEFMDCHHIKVSGTGDSSERYGFTLQASECGLAFTGLSSDCEAEFIEIIGGENTFFGIYAKKDFGGNPPVPYPQFNNLIIHDMYIHGVSEGMYIGETTSPGMEFRHVRVYNNIITDTHRESIQIANCVEDIEIFNNLMMNTGLHHLGSQENILQIGGNSVAKVYNNILVNGPTYGVIVFGMGDIEVFNNYSENNLGVFIDDRYWTIENSPINIHQNYFLKLNGSEVIKNMNQYNDLYLTDNLYNTNIPFFLNAADAPPVLVLENNSLETIETLNFTIENGIFKPNSNNSSNYAGIGPIYANEPIPERIVLTKEQVTDLVLRGSLISPESLVDEQQLDPALDQHPVSSPWIPGKNLKYAPFHTEINLGGNYFIESIYLHDVKHSGNIVISALINDEWLNLLTDPCKNSGTWNQHALNVTTRVIRLSMYNTAKAKVNEIALYGYSIDEGGIKSGEVNAQSNNQPKPIATNYCLYPNPATDHLNIAYSETFQTVEISDLTGRLLIKTNQRRINLTSLSGGLYSVRLIGADDKPVFTEKLIISK